jgi:hypothetical protein
MQILIIRSLVTALLLLVTSCSGHNKNETIDLEKIRPKSESKITNKRNVYIDSNEIILQSYYNDSINLKLTKLRVNQNLSFLNRFPNKKSGLRTLMKEDTCIQIQHEFYEYIDSNQMKNAFFNWLDCNGKDCKSIKLYEETKIEQQNLLVVTTSKSIDIFRSVTNLSPNEWVDFVRFSRNTKTFKYILFQKKNQKSKWFYFKENKLVLKTKN